MLPLNPPLTKQDFINSGCKEVVNSSSQDCFSYSLAFFSKLQNAKQTGNIKNQAVFQILVDVSSDEIEPSATKNLFLKFFSTSQMNT